jgi:uncharacterized membrane protein
MKIHTALGVFFCLLVSACYFDKAEELYPSNYNQTDTSAATFTNFVAPLINNKCMNCHNVTPPILGNYSKLKLIVDNGKFNERVIVQKNMPPSGLTNTELEKIKQWLAAGALNN